jgi:transcriptional regulator of met regulon
MAYERLTIDLPVEYYQWLRAEVEQRKAAHRRDATMRAIVLEMFAEHSGIPLPDGPFLWGHRGEGFPRAGAPSRAEVEAQRDFERQYGAKPGEGGR